MQDHTKSDPWGLGLTAGLLGAVVAVMLAIPMMLTWERPPIAATQLGPDGLAMMDIQNPRRTERLAALNVAPPSADPVEPSGTKASEVYENVQVLGDIDSDQFNRLMGSITEWIAPTEGDNAGCAYCHNVENMADDTVYTKVVARRMIQMTRALNTQWKDHTGATGVTCYTCHRGNAVPKNVWWKNDGPRQALGPVGNRQGQNVAGIGSTSMHTDPFSDLLTYVDTIRVVEKGVLPDGKTSSTQATEKTYALMVHMSKALGVNCTFCHNSRQFSDWSQSRPQRVTAWYGLRMASDANKTYIESLTSVFPANRKGPHGDVFKVNCATCHQGVNKPLLGAQMAKDYPELTQPNP